jgi:hypothetical protein
MVAACIPLPMAYIDRTLLLLVVDNNLWCTKKINNLTCPNKHKLGGGIGLHASLISGSVRGTGSSLMAPKLTRLEFSVLWTRYGTCEHKEWRTHYRKQARRMLNNLDHFSAKEEVFVPVLVDWPLRKNSQALSPRGHGTISS